MPTETGRFSATGEITGFHGVDIQNILRGGLPRADPELWSLYTYDAMERLTKESLNGAVTSYGYDLAGNRITKSTDGRTIMMQKATAIPSPKRTR